jgi:phospholipid transport system substrate-binding protein
VQAYSSKLGQYAGAPFRVTGSRPNGDETVVTSQVVRAGGNPVEIDWHLINRGGRYLITDVFVDGVSMGVTQRNEFAGIIQRNGPAGCAARRASPAGGQGALALSLH